MHMHKYFYTLRVVVRYISVSITRMCLWFLLREGRADGGGRKGREEGSSKSVWFGKWKDDEP